MFKGLGTPGIHFVKVSAVLSSGVRWVLLRLFNEGGSARKLASGNRSCHIAVNHKNTVAKLY